MQNDVDTATVESSVQVEQVGTQQQTQQEQKPVRTFTREDVAKMISAERSKWQAEQEEKANEAKRLAKMNAEEKAEHERQKLKQRIAELEAKEARTQMTSTVRGMLSEAKIQASDDLLNLLVSTDAENTKQAVESFIGLFNKTVEATVTERLKGKTPSKGSVSGALTRESIMSVQNRDERQRLIQENAGLFSN